MNAPESHDPAARLHRALRELPDVPAPRSLEGRVLATLAARASRPWWRQPVTAWPAGARAAVVGLGLAAAAGVTTLGGFAVEDGVAAAESGPWFGPANGLWTALRSLGGAAAAAAGSMPPWILYTLAASVVVSAALLGGGIAAYRSLCTRD